jgi:UDP-N-acetylmuramoylalanine--D-glutamate ligase
MKSPKHIAILGYGIEGKSAKRFLRTKFPKARIEVRDKKNGLDYLKGLEQLDMIVRSPGVPYLLPEIQRAEKQGVIVSSVTKLFFSALGRPAWGGQPPITIGITGTKGKGTTASMLLSILKAAKKKSFLVGNIGVPMLSVFPKLTRDTVTIVELSSFQLQDLDTSPHIAVVLEIAPDHQDYHHSMQEYVRAKSNIARHQKKNDTCIYIKRNKYAALIARQSKGKKIAVDVVTEGEYWEDLLTVPGHYNTYNAAVAANIARALGIDEKYIEQGLKKFKGLPYHMEVVETKNKIRYINDSASTNPVSTKAALESIDTPVVLIAGGVDKNFDYRILAPVVASREMRSIVLFGKNKKTIAAALPKANVVFSDSLVDAVHKAQNFAHAGDTILFSPASASFDMFKNSKDRGTQFSRLVAKKPL